MAASAAHAEGHRLDGRAERARTRLRDRSWKIAAFGALVGPFAALTQAGPDAAGVTDVHRAVQSLLVVILLIATGEALSLGYYVVDRRRSTARPR